MRVVLMGPPGAGKGTQAKDLAQSLGVPHVASGDLLREHRAAGTELGRKANTYMERGLLVPDEVVIKMMHERLSSQDCQQGFVLDGFPRTLQQAQALDEALKERGIELVINIAVSAEELVRRLGGRLTCRACQFTYHPVSAPPRVEGVCDRCGGALYQRDDDRPEAVRQRIEVYNVQTAPLIDYYRRQGKLKEINGEQAIEKVATELRALVQGPLSGRKAR
ncbi:MAG: adenylate kinase [Chloroflexi bacterium]|nr:adenylate kinase [Chloroflexota bacterium]